jgi:hypothetical protein
MFARTLSSRRAFAALAITLLGADALMIGSANAAGAATTGVPSHHSVVSATSTRVTPFPQATTPCGAFQFNFAEFNRCTGRTWAGALCQVNANYNGSNGPFNVLAAASDCGTRVWLHQDAWNGSNWGSGWSFCISPGVGENVPSQFQHPLNIFISNNLANC